jgi:hypothetical protein
MRRQCLLKAAAFHSAEQINVGEYFWVQFELNVSNLREESTLFLNYDASQLLSLVLPASDEARIAENEEFPRNKPLLATANLQSLSVWA